MIAFYDKFLTRQIINPQIAHNYVYVGGKRKWLAVWKLTSGNFASTMEGLYSTRGPRKMEMDRYYSITIPFLYQLQLRAVIAVTSYFGLDFMGDGRQLCVRRETNLLEFRFPHLI